MLASDLVCKAVAGMNPDFDMLRGFLLASKPVAELTLINKSINQRGRQYLTRAVGLRNCKILH